MNINNFEQEVDPKILDRGEKYFTSGLVELYESEGNHYEATVAGTEYYTTKVSLRANGKITELSCNCPYEFGVCKHEVAVLLAIRNDMKTSAAKKPRKTKSEKETLKELLEAQTKETLVALLCSVAENDRALRQALLLRFSRQDNELEYSRKLVREHIRRCKTHGYIEWNETDAALTGAREVLSRAEEAAQSDCIRAVRLCFVVLTEIFAMISYCDDSNENVAEIMEQCTETVRKAALAAQDLPKPSRDELFALIFEEAICDIYKGWPELRLSFFDCLAPLAGDPALYQKLWDRLEYERNNVTEYDRYYEQEIAQLQLQLLTQWENKEKSRNFLLDHLQYRDFRKQVIAEAMNMSDYETALRYAQEGLKHDDKQRPGYAHEWRVASFEAYRAMGNTKKMRELAEYFVKYERDGMNYYNVLKNTTPSEKWPETLRNLLVFFERHQSSNYQEILIVEKDFDRLLSICRQNHSKIVEFCTFFPKSYKPEVEQLYRAYILEQAKTAGSRKMYQEVCGSLIDFGDVCGEDRMNELAQKIKTEHPHQPAFLDELGKLL